MTNLVDTSLATINTSITFGQVLTYAYLFAVATFLFVLWKTSRDDNNKFHWIDIVSGPDGSASLTRILQLVAGVTGTWVVVQATAGKWLNVDIFAVYLAAMGISEGFTKWIQSKNQQQQTTPDKE